MKSKSFDLKLSGASKHTASDKTIDFVGLYKSAAETSKVVEKRKSDEIINKETPKTKTGTPKRVFTHNKNKKRSKPDTVDISHINIDGSNLSLNFPRSSPIDDSQLTSTPNANGKNQSVKSIMKTKSPAEHQSFDSARSSASSAKPKKRHKSVSFMLEDHEEVEVKRTKSDDSEVKKPETITKTFKNIRKDKELKTLEMNQQSEKENKAADSNSLKMEVDSSKLSVPKKKLAKFNKTKKMLGESPPGEPQVSPQQSKEKKKRLKKVKKTKSEQSTEPNDADTSGEVSSDIKVKKHRKKKVKAAPVESTEAEGEPASKARKTDGMPDISEDLENVSEKFVSACALSPVLRSTGDNVNTLTNLLDEMTVVDKDKKKKLRQKFNKNKKQKGTQISSKEDSDKSEEVKDKSEEVKEKVKWKKRKWNKDKKGEADEEGIANTVIVESLPISIMLHYKKLLTDHFVKHGLIKKIGIAEVYPTEDSKPVFTTTLNFFSDTAAEQALQENNVYIEGNRIRVKKPLPMTQTTLVVRSYGDLTDQAVSSAFHSVGRIRSIRHLVKGKKGMATAFVEFDGPQAVEKAIKTLGDTRIGGKKIHLSKFEIRSKKDKKPKNEGDSAADADSEDSND
ncbi:hypothetical protein PYW07_014928 [Mythimna separata]|uniref:RRM domain-containing protein n=1 Tax=Mythimna separata TaxID=271217 RepID=A0AAD8DZC9_MYTSE|nr:hypothetical protein PYW07_014928 [Mythimna separata]